MIVTAIVTEGLVSNALLISNAALLTALLTPDVSNALLTSDVSNALLTSDVSNALLISNESLLISNESLLTRGQ